MVTHPPPQAIANIYKKKNQRYTPQHVLLSRRMQANVFMGVVNGTMSVITRDDSQLQALTNKVRGASPWVMGVMVAKGPRSVCQDRQIRGRFPTSIEKLVCIGCRIYRLRGRTAGALVRAKITSVSSPVASLKSSLNLRRPTPPSCSLVTRLPSYKGHDISHKNPKCLHFHRIGLVTPRRKACRLWQRQWAVWCPGRYEPSHKRRGTSSPSSGSLTASISSQSLTPSPSESF